MKLIGQERQWEGLARAFSKDRLPNTLLISGPPHVGKTTLVTGYGQLLLCPDVTMDALGLPAPCGVCATCRQVAKGQATDFRSYGPLVSAEDDERNWVTAPEILDSSVITIAVARKFADEAMMKPMGGKRRVLVLRQIDRLTDDARNCLLKTFEEPPADTFLVLTSDNASRILPTVLSRCWHLPLVTVDEPRMTAWLTQEFPEHNRKEIEAAVRAAHGRPGAAYTELCKSREAESESEHVPRRTVAAQLLARAGRASAVGALGLTEDALKWSKVWWEEDAGEAGELKKAAAKVNRAAAAHFLDELALAVRAQWLAEVTVPGGAELGAARLDLIRKTRQYILRNANLNLALDVMFGRLIAMRLPSA